MERWRVIAKPQWLVRAEEIMSLERILVPVDIAKWPVEVFTVANTFAKHPGVTVTLLHVVTLNIAVPEKGVYEALGREALWHLERLARKCLRPGVATITSVRFGKPAEEILAEAVAGNIDLIVLAAKPPSFWSRFFAPLVPRVVERVIREATCGVFLATAKKWFNCESLWGRPRNDIDAASGPLDEAVESDPSRVSLTEDAFASAQERHHAIA
jgi:nucleotide-binding universal stress UspA family protein